MISEPSSNGALHLVYPSIECLTVLDQGSELAMSLLRHMYDFEFTHGSHANKLQCVILAGLSFDIGPLPSDFNSRNHECFEAEAYSKIADLAGRPAGFHGDEVNFMFFEDGSKVIAISCCV